MKTSHCCKFIFIIGLVYFLIYTVHSQTRIKDIVRVENTHKTSLIGYGLVVGLNGSGDRSSGSRGAVFTVQSISNMLERFGITVSKDQLRIRNVAAVIVTSSVPAFGRVGSQFDVTISSLGDATSLEGGVLLMTPLLDQAGNNFGMAQGPVSIGGYNIQTAGGEKLRKNHALVGRIPAGGYLTVAPPNQDIDTGKPMRLHLLEPDFLTAQRIAQEINNNLGNNSNSAKAISPGLVELTFPTNINDQYLAVGFIAAIETLQVSPDMDARVVINERTGTVVAGGTVTIGEVMISHGNLTIHTRQRPIISQPQAPFSNAGNTVVVPVTDTQVDEEVAKSAVIQQTTTVSDLASALNQLGLKPRDVISIFQAIKQAGALRASLIII